MLRFSRRTLSSGVVLLLFFSTGLFISFQNFFVPQTFDIYIAATGSSDANSGNSYTSSIRTFDRAQAILQKENPQKPVRIFVAAGDYYCRGLNGVWIFQNGYPISIESIQNLPSPAFSSAEDPRRPIFYGKKSDGTNCERSIWFDVAHSDTPMNLTFKGLKVTQFRGGITIREQMNRIPKNRQNIIIDNMVFERIGDYYYKTATPGKGVLLVSYTNGVKVLNSYFNQVRNSDPYSGLIHSIYFSSFASYSLVQKNHFHGHSGSAIKLTHQSNSNVFSGNRFSAMPTAIVDRWCGALSSDDIEAVCANGVPQCPSWDNDFSLDNISSSLSFSKSAVVYSIPRGQNCGHPAAKSGVRMYLPEGPIKE